MSIYGLIKVQIKITETEKESTLGLSQPLRVQVLIIVLKKGGDAISNGESLRESDIEKGRVWRDSSAFL